MEPGTRRRTRRSDNAIAWWVSLNSVSTAPGPPSRALAATLACAALAAGASLPLVWHHELLPNPAFYGPPTLAVYNGVGADSWLFAVVAITLGLAVRALLRAPTTGVAAAVAILAFATVDGMFIDYFDWSRRGVSLQVNAYFGPGFYVGLSSAGVLVVAAILAWRVRS
jgi:hypothetical protein